MNIIDYLSQLAPLLSFLTILVAVIFGIIQFKQFSRQRKDLAAVEVMRSLQNRDFTDSLMLINKIDNGLSRKEIQKNSNELESSILALVTKFETLGFLVFRKIIPIEFVEQLVGGECIRIWNKLEQYTLDFRKEENNPVLLEWFEWLTFSLSSVKGINLYRLKKNILTGNHNNLGASYKKLFATIGIVLC